MHEVEGKMNENQWSVYTIELNKICCRIICGNNPKCGYTIHASSRQRAEAYLKTIKTDITLWDKLIN